MSSKATVDYDSHSVISDCGTWRYRLDRVWDENRPRVLFAMLNPSTATHEVTDPTDTKVRGFARAWGFGGYTIVNLGAYRATDPDELKGLLTSVAVGPDNDRHVAEVAAECQLLVAAWGASYPKHLWFRTHVVREILDRFGDVHHLGLTKAGDPRHPLFLRGDTKPQPWKGSDV